MDFNEKGLLGTAIDAFSKSVQLQYARFFELSYQIDELAHATKFELQVHNRDPQEYLAATLFLRLLSGFEATVILGTKGLLFEAKVVLRSVIETLFILKLLCQEEAFCSRILGVEQGAESEVDEHCARKPRLKLRIPKMIRNSTGHGSSEKRDRATWFKEIGG